MFALKQNSQSSVGLDIGNSSVKLVQLHVDPKSKSRELISFDSNPIAGQGRAEIVKAIQQTAANVQLQSRYVNTSVSGQSVIVRYIQMPKMTRAELGNALRFEAGKYIPFNVEEVIYDFQILGDDPQRAGKNIKVLLVAVKKEIIGERIKILNEAGLVPRIIDVDSFAAINSFQLLSQQDRGIIAVLDVGADVTSIILLQDNVPFFNRDIMFGGARMTRAITEEFEISAEDAEHLKQNPQQRYEELINAIKPQLDVLCRELHLSFNFCESQRGCAVEKIFLTGGTAKLKGIDKILNGILGVEVEIWDPTQKININPAFSGDRLKAAGPLLSVAIGLALRG